MTELKTTEAIPQTELQRLVRMQAEVKEANGERAGDYGDEVKAAADKYGVNKKALSMVCTLNRMTREKRDDVLRSFDNYTVMMGWEVEADLVDRMEDATDATDATGQTEQAGPSRSGTEIVHPIQPTVN